LIDLDKMQSVGAAFFVTFLFTYDLFFDTITFKEYQL